MASVPSKVTSIPPAPEEIVYSGHGLLLYRADKSFTYAENYAVIGSSLSEGAPDITSKGRIEKVGLATTYALTAVLWAILSGVFFLVSWFGITLSGMDPNTVLFAIQSAFSLIMGAGLTLKVTTGCVAGKGYFEMVDKFVSKTQLKVELDSTRKRKEDAPAPATAMKLSPTIAESVRSLLALPVTDEQDLVGKVTRKLESDATDDELYEWCRLAASVFTHNPEFPAQYIPELSSDLAIVEDTVRVQMITAAAEAIALSAVEDTTRAEIGKHFEEVDSASSLAGAMAWLGVSTENG